MSRSNASVEAGMETAAPAWKAELNAKLEAHRQRRLPGMEGTGAEGRVGGREAAPVAGRAAASRVAARVAERYAKAPSYSEVLAQRAAALTAAAEAASVAAQQAQVATEELLESLASPEMAGALAEEERQEREWVDAGTERAAGSVAEVAVPERQRKSWAAGETTIEHPEPLPVRGVVPARTEGRRSVPSGIVDAFAEAEVAPATSLPAKLIEFPRELFAARKTRPRIAEGPLAEDPATAGAETGEEKDSPGGIRIFEVGGGGRTGADRNDSRVGAAPVEEQVRGLPSRDRGEAVAVPQWQSIRLGEHPAGAGEGLTLRHRRIAEAPSAARAVLHVASLEDRAMAALVDLALVGFGWLAFVAAFAACATHLPAGRVALVGGAAVLVGLGAFYQWLFLRYGGTTPGMRYARIALCTFEDENPTRAMAQRRVWAGLLAAAPAGLGLAWAVLDEDALGWQDRMTRTYQRSYR